MLLGVQKNALFCKKGHFLPFILPKNDENTTRFWVLTGRPAVRRTTGVIKNLLQQIIYQKKCIFWKFEKMTRKCGILKGFWGPKMGKFYTTFLLRLEIRFFRKITKMCDLLWFLRQLKCRNFWRKMCFFLSEGAANIA